MYKYLAIDASNITSGGGLTHLKEILNHYEFRKSKFNKIFIYSSKKTLNILPSRSDYIKISNYFLNSNYYLFRYFWQIFLLPYDLKKKNIKLLFVPGSIHLSSFKNTITMCQNLLPWDPVLVKKYFFSKKYLRLKLLYYIHFFSFKRSIAIIFLSNYAKKKIITKIGNKKNIVINHGVSSFFVNHQRKFQDLNFYNSQNPLKITYLSSVDYYKNQDLLIISFLNLLKKRKFPIQLNLVGHIYDPYYQKLTKLIPDKYNKYIKFTGEIDHHEVQNYLNESEIGVFLSVCENFPISFIEMISSKLPIICNNLKPMTEINTKGIFLIKENSSKSLEIALEKLLISKILRKNYANTSFMVAKNYTWEKSAKNLFNYLNLF